MPEPWTMRMWLIPARKARSTNFSTSAVASSTLRPITLSLCGGRGFVVAEADVDSFAAGGVHGIVGGLRDDGGDVIEGDAHLHGADLDFDGIALQFAHDLARCGRWI